jgi:hypothetical protein
MDLVYRRQSAAANGSSGVSVSTSTTEITEIAERVLRFWLGALGRLGGDRRFDRSAVRLEELGRPDSL